VTRRKRPPTAEELRLWRLVTETVEPFGDRALQDEPDAEISPLPKSRPPPQPAAIIPPKPARPKSPPSLSPMDRRARSRVSRGTVAIDRRVDLHGLTQADAERRLSRFLEGAQSEDAKVVLVITGKGKVSASGREEERGVLRRMVPMWLSAPAMRSIVVGFEEAAQSHGGTGALYVRIRKRRG
jgi:DNA-nicking Smr family endonuclease